MPRHVKTVHAREIVSGDIIVPAHGHPHQHVIEAEGLTNVPSKVILRYAYRADGRPTGTIVAEGGKTYQVLR